MSACACRGGGGVGVGRVRVLVAIEVVVAPAAGQRRLRAELTAAEEAAEGLPELVRHRVVQDGVDGAETEGQVRREKMHSKNSANKFNSENSIT